MTTETKFSPLQAQLAPIEAFLEAHGFEVEKAVHVGLGAAVNASFFDRIHHGKLHEALGDPASAEGGCDVAQWRPTETRPFEVVAYWWPREKCPTCKR